MIYIIVRMTTINRKQRDSYTALIRSFYNGEITNFEYTDRFEKMPALDPSDPAVDRIYLVLWHTYSDVHEHKMLGDHALPDETRKLIDRCLCFLESGIEYGWPDSHKQAGCLLTILTFGIYSKRFNARLKQEMSEYGDLDYWPFRNKNELDKATPANAAERRTKKGEIK
jgi:hypothetical protein